MEHKSWRVRDFEFFTAAFRGAFALPNAHDFLLDIVVTNFGDPPSALRLRPLMRIFFATNVRCHPIKEAIDIDK